MSFVCLTLPCTKSVFSEIHVSNRVPADSSFAYHEHGHRMHRGIDNEVVEKCNRTRYFQIIIDVKINMNFPSRHPERGGLRGNLCMINQKQTTQTEFKPNSV